MSDDDVLKEIKSAGVWIKTGYGVKTPEGFEQNSAPFQAADIIGMQRQELEALREQNKRMEEALLRLRMWGGIGAGKGYSATEAFAFADWIDGGMTGELPPYPEHYKPFRS